MKKAKSFISILLSISLIFSFSLISQRKEKKVQAFVAYRAITDSDFLKASGKQLVKDNGQTVVLRGTNVGNYLMQELWMSPTSETDNVKCQKQIIDVLTSRFGKERAQELLDVYEENYFTEDDFKNCADMGMNVLRLPFWYKNIVDDDGNVKANAFDRIDWFVKTAGQYGMYVILDMHGAPGSQNGIQISGDISSGVGLFVGDNVIENQNLTVSIWKAIASHYKDNPIVAGYDLLNEPYTSADYPYTSETIWVLYDRLYDEIREIDDKHMIIMEAVWNPSTLPKPDKYGWENIMYEYHQYNYESQTNAEDQLSGINTKLRQIDRAGYNVPSYIGETSFFSNIESWEKCLDRLNEYGINWTTWSYKTVGSGTNSWGIYNQNIRSVNIETESDSQIERKWASVKNATPNQEIYDVIYNHLPKQIIEVEGEGRYEAENANYISVGGVTKLNNSFSGTGYVESLNNNIKSDMENAKCILFNLTVNLSGTYQVMLGYATTTATQYAVSVNDEDWIFRDIASTGSWDTVWEAPVLVHLNAGDNTIKITGSVDENSGGKTWVVLDYFDLSLNQLDEPITAQETNVTQESSAGTTIEASSNVTENSSATVETTKETISTTVMPETTKESLSTTVISESIKEITGTTITSETTGETISTTTDAGTTKIDVPRTKIIKLKNLKKKRIRVRIKKLNGVTGYQIKYAKNKKLKKARYKTIKKTSVILKKLKKNKRYYFKVRAYILLKGIRNYGKWSTRKSIIIKK